MKEPSITPASVLLLIGVAQNILLALALVIVRKRNKLANRILAALLLLFSASLIEGFLFHTSYYFKYPHLIALEWPTAFLYGPLGYFYIRTLTSPEEFAFRRNHLLHLIPFGMYIVLLTPFYLLPADEKARLLALSLSHMEKEPGFNLDPMFLVLVTQMAAYLIASLRLIAAYSVKLKQNFSSIEKINLTWLRDLFIALFGLWCVFSIASAFASRYGVYRESMYFLRLTEAAVVFVMGIKGLSQPQVFIRIEALQPAGNIQNGREAPDAGAPSDESQAIANNAEKGKYRRSSLTDEQSSNILRLLTRVMETDRPFLEPELTLPELSDRLSVSPNHLSQVLNEKLAKNFFDFVNEYRVEEAKKLLLSPQFNHFSILGVAMEAGFNSKSSFYTAFKKHAGMTPSRFKDQRSAK